MPESVGNLSKLTELQRNYLAEIYQACRIESNGNGGYVSSAQLAERLFTSQSTVNRVIERLRNKHLIQHARYTGVRLTKVGEQEALEVLRRQAVIEAFLHEVMGFGWHEVTPEARQIRHHLSKQVLDRMWELAGRPARSPFGEWIKPPDSAKLHDRVLAYAEIEQDYVIARVLTRQPDRLEYLASLGLRPDVCLRLLHRAPFDGPLQIKLEREFRIIGHELAEMITVLRK